MQKHYLFVFFFLSLVVYTTCEIPIWCCGGVNIKWEVVTVKLVMVPIGVLWINVIQS